MILSVDAKNSMLQGFADRLNIGTNAELTIYIGADIAANFDMPNPIEQSINDGVLLFNLPDRVLAELSGTPTSAKLVNSLGVNLAEFDIGSEIVLDKPEVYAGGYVNLARLTITI
tara:strand:+ start:1148 stop:1492 length:345 start_codon:yes stop_codon:yes gene_type:complete